MMKFSGMVLLGSLLVAGSAAAQTVDRVETSIQDKKHVETLFQAQDPTKPTLTREQIAAYRSDSGWGKAFKEMQADGYYADYKNFGQVVSGSKAKKIKAHRAANDYKAAKRDKVQNVRRMTRVKRPNRPKRPKRR